MSDDDEDLAALAAMMDDDEDGGLDFITDEQREEEEARQRRLARKRRLEKVKIEESDLQPQTKAIKQEAGSSAAKSEPSNSSSDFARTAAAAQAVAAASLKEEENQENNIDQKNPSAAATDPEDDDIFDMFNTSVSPPVPVAKKARNENSTNNTSTSRHKDDVDDVEGYYKASIGEIMNFEIVKASGEDDDDPGASSSSKLELRVLGIIGKGVFSSVLKCSVVGKNGENSTSTATQQNLPPEVAVKCIRSNETMAKAALSEMKFLIMLRNAPGVVPLILPTISANAENRHITRPPPPIDYKGHSLLIFPYQPYNLRDVLLKFGRGVGLSLTAVRSYFGQLLAAATHLQKHHIIHADIKPDNILVSGDFGTVQICDFGSAMDAATGESEGMITPYLVSRFYRAPEIILGLPINYQVDLWSLAVTAAELFLGNVLLRGTTNNDMLYQMMALMGPFSQRQIRQHILQTKKHPLPVHFLQQQSQYVFRQETIDPVLGKPVHKEVSLASSDSNDGKFKPSLQSKLLKARSPKDSRVDVLKFSDLLSKCLVLDPSKRITVKAALQHDFFKEKTTDNNQK